MRMGVKIQEGLKRRVRVWEESGTMHDRGFRKPGSQNRRKGLGRPRRGR